MLLFGYFHVTPVSETQGGLYIVSQAESIALQGKSSLAWKWDSGVGLLPTGWFGTRQKRFSPAQRTWPVGEGRLLQAVVLRGLARGAHDDQQCGAVLLGPFPCHRAQEQRGQRPWPGALAVGREKVLQALAQSPCFVYLMAIGQVLWAIPDEAI